MSHHIRFTRHVATGETRVTCTCGWSHSSDRDTARACADDHLHRRAPADQTPIRPRTSGFVSGLAD